MTTDKQTSGVDLRPETIRTPGLFVVTSPDRMAANWQASTSNARQGLPSGFELQRLLARVNTHAELVTVLDGHPLALAWIGAATGHRVRLLGVTNFGTSGSLQEVYAWHKIDSDTIVAALLEGQEVERARPLVDSAIG